MKVIESEKSRRILQLKNKENKRHWRCLAVVSFFFIFLILFLIQCEMVYLG